MWVSIGLAIAQLLLSQLVLGARVGSCVLAAALALPALLLSRSRRVRIFGVLLILVSLYLAHANSVAGAERFRRSLRLVEQSWLLQQQSWLRQTQGKQTVLHQIPMPGGGEISIVRGPVIPATGLAEPGSTGQTAAVFDVGIQISSRNEDVLLTLVSWLESVRLTSEAEVLALTQDGTGEGLSIPGWNVLDVAHRTGQVVKQPEIVIALRTYGALDLILWNGIELKRISPKFSDSESSVDPASATLSYSADRWIVDVTSGTRSRLRHTTLEQIDPQEWKFGVKSFRYEEVSP